MNKLTSILKQMARRFLDQRGYHISRIDSLYYLEPLLYLLLRKNKEIFFIQIGANDGVMADPIYQFVRRNHKKVKGIVIEPMKDVFCQLKDTYRNISNITPVNLAIHNSEKEMLLYKIDPSKLKEFPEGAKGIASFNKDHHKLTNTPTDVIITERVNCVSLDELCKNYQITKIDLLQIDTEGYDSEIIINIDFDTIKPSIIRFEHGLRAGIMSNEIFLAVIDLLHRKDYELIIELDDATAYHRNLFVDLYHDL